MFSMVRCVYPSDSFLTFRHVWSAMSVCRRLGLFGWWAPTLALLCLCAAPASGLAEEIGVDVDGDGARDLVSVFGGDDASVRIEVMLNGTGETLSDDVDGAFVGEPFLRGTRDVDGRSGAELLVHTGHISTFDSYRIYTVRRNRLQSYGTFTQNASLGDGYAFGFSCTAAGTDRRLTTYSFSQNYPRKTYKRTVKRYRFVDGRLVRVGNTLTSNIRRPADRERRIGCR